MKKYLFIVFFLVTLCVKGKSQTFNLSEEVNINRAEMYGVIGKVNDRTLFFYVEDGYITIKAFDEKMNRVGEKKIEPEKRHSVKVFDVLAGKSDFCVLYEYRKHGRYYFKIEKYDASLRLLDSMSIAGARVGLMDEFSTTMVHSEDRRAVAFYAILGSENLEATSVDLDSMRMIQSKKYSVKGIDLKEDFKEALVSNKGDIFLAFENHNEIGRIQKHSVSVMAYSVEGGEAQYNVPIKEYISTGMKFAFDNLHNQLVACGLYTKKGGFKTQGYFTAYINASPNPTIGFHPFDDEFMSSIKGRKVSKNKGLADVKIQEIAFRKDGGIMLFVEQVEERSRAVNSYSYTGAYIQSGGRPLLAQKDYYYDNIFVFSIHPNGEQHWRTVLYKKQYSQNDDAAFCSFFLMRNSGALRLIFNDEVQRRTTVSEYVVNGAGQYEHHAILNTEGQNVYLRFHDSVQTGSNEIVAPSEDKHRVRLLKVVY